ncbi:MAG TPA: pirin family protein [Firmicutes bacterium]|nr:pirin family protein [Bacillota bacterium]
MERKVVQKVKGYLTQDGAGVNLVRVLGHETIEQYDPILMLDSFDSRNPDDYTAGFPIHPHRGIETISYVSSGKMMHRDSLGHSDTIEDGEVQWMTAGSGILHEEMLPASERVLGVQLWLNLPAKDKMATPQYHSLKRKDIEEIPFDGGTIRLLAGKYKDKSGFLGQYLPLDYYDIHLNDNSEISIDTDEKRSVLLFTLVGEIIIGDTLIEEKTAAKLSDGDKVIIQSGSEGAQVLLISSVPLGEPIAWGGSIVMNTQDELQQAFDELRNGTFIRSNPINQ